MLLSPSRALYNSAGTRHSISTHSYFIFAVNWSRRFILPAMTGLAESDNFERITWSCCLHAPKLKVNGIRGGATTCVRHVVVGGWGPLGYPLCTSVVSLLVLDVRCVRVSAGRCLTCSYIPRIHLFCFRGWLRLFPIRICI